MCYIKVLIKNSQGNNSPRMHYALGGLRVAFIKLLGSC